jgi:hypothetical protein
VDLTAADSQVDAAQDLDALRRRPQALDHELAHGSTT